MAVGESTRGTPPAPRRTRFGDWWMWVIGIGLVGAVAAFFIVASTDNDPETLLVGTSGIDERLQPGLEEGDRVQVTGVVREFLDERDPGEGERVGDTENERVIVASSIEQVGDEVESPGPTIETLAEEDEGEQFEGDEVTVVGEVFDDQVGADSFRITELD